MSTCLSISSEVSIDDEDVSQYNNKNKYKSDLMYCRFKPDKTLTYVNDKYSEYLGEKKEDIIGEKFTKFIPENKRKSVMEHFKKILKFKKPKSHEHKILNDKGKDLYVKWTNIPIVDKDGEIKIIESIGIDITSLYQAKHEPENFNTNFFQKKFQNFIKSALKDYDLFHIYNSIQTSFRLMNGVKDGFDEEIDKFKAKSFLLKISVYDMFSHKSNYAIKYYKVVNNTFDTTKKYYNHIQHKDDDNIFEITYSQYGDIVYNKLHTDKLTSYNKKVYIKYNNNDTFSILSEYRNKSTGKIFDRTFISSDKQNVPKWVDCSRAYKSDKDLVKGYCF